MRPGANGHGCCKPLGRSSVLVYATLSRMCLGNIPRPIHEVGLKPGALWNDWGRIRWRIHVSPYAIDHVTAILDGTGDFLCGLGPKSPADPTENMRIESDLQTTTTPHSQELPWNGNGVKRKPCRLQCCTA